MDSNVAPYNAPHYHTTWQNENILRTLIFKPNERKVSDLGLYAQYTPITACLIFVHWRKEGVVERRT